MYPTVRNVNPNMMRRKARLQANQAQSIFLDKSTAFGKDAHVPNTISLERNPKEDVLVYRW